MDKVLSKFGIYDIIGIMLSGLIITSISISVFNLTDFPKEIVSKFTVINGTVSFLIGSYLIGLVFQELGSIMDKYVLFRKNKILKKALRTKVWKDGSIPLRSHTYMDETEKVGIYRYVIEKANINISSIDQKEDSDIINIVENNDNNNNDIYLNQIYHYCKHSLLTNASSSGINKDQSISALCRSLCIYFFSLSIFSLIYILFHLRSITVSFIIIFIVSLLLFFLFFHKFQRHAQIRHIYIFRWFYYNFVIPNKKCHSDKKTIIKVKPIKQKNTHYYIIK